jgi:hypothetical protein
LSTAWWEAVVRPGQVELEQLGGGRGCADPAHKLVKAFTEPPVEAPAAWSSRPAWMVQTEHGDGVGAQLREQGAFGGGHRRIRGEYDNLGVRAFACRVRPSRVVIMNGPGPGGVDQLDTGRQQRGRQMHIDGADGSTFLSHGGSRQGALAALVPRGLR